MASRCLLLLACCAAGCVSAEEKSDELKPGVLAEYYEFDHELNDFPSIKGKAPLWVKIDKQIAFDCTEGDFDGTGLNDFFYAYWSGKIRIAKEARYTFCTESDDGSRLLIDGKVVVDNGGLHGMAEKDGDVELAAGDHDIVIEFFENGGGAGCKLSWSVDDKEKALVPAEALFHNKALELDKDGKSRLARCDWPDWEF
jgi:hypothetical protein